MHGYREEVRRRTEERLKSSGMQDEVAMLSFSAIRSANLSLIDDNRCMRVIWRDECRIIIARGCRPQHHPQAPSTDGAVTITRFYSVVADLIESSTRTPPPLLPLLHPNSLKYVMNTIRRCIFVALVLQYFHFVPNSTIPLQLSPWHPY